MRLAEPLMISERSKLILSVSLPRLSVHADEVRELICRQKAEQSRIAFTELAYIPGVEALATLASLSSTVRGKAIKIAKLTPSQQAGIEEIIKMLGNASSDPQSLAETLIRAYPTATEPLEVVDPEIRLTFTRDEAGCKARVTLVGPDGVTDGGPGKPFNFDLSEEDYSDLRWYLEEYMDLPDHGSVVRANRVEKSLGDWGRGLFRAVFDAGDHRELFLAFMRTKASRLMTLATSDPDILRLPWELMADKKGPLAQQEVTLRRQLETVKGNSEVKIGTPLRVLLIVSRPDDAGFIDPRNSARAVLDGLEPLKKEVLVDFCLPPTLAEMEQRISDAAKNKEPYHIVHFDGHGDYDPLLGLGILAFEEADQEGVALVKTDNVPADRLGALLAKHNIPLVILEACRTSQVGGFAFRSIAPKLIESGVGSVIAMSYAVHVETSRILMERFYKELASGQSVGQAMEHGRSALTARAARWIEPGPNGRKINLVDWFLPQLYQRGKDPVLVAPNKNLPPTLSGRIRREPAQGSQPGAFPRPPRYDFQGRAWELNKLTRVLAREKGVLLHAMGGMGKTTLAREAAFWLTRSGMFPHGACFISFEQPTTAGRIAQVLGAYLEGHKFESLKEEEQLSRARQLFRDNRVLMVWDNFENTLPEFSPDQEEVCTDDERRKITDLYLDWTQSTNCKGRLLITCRPENTPLAGVRRIELKGLARSDSFYLLSRVMRERDLALDDPRFNKEELNDLLATLADHPLSIELVGPHLKEQSPKQIIEEFDKLLESFVGDAESERNSSLLASLRYSTDRLGDGARAALRWLGLFQGGVFEQLLLSISQMDAKEWSTVKGELMATALVREENEITLADRPFLRFHPTLASAADIISNNSIDQPEARTRFVGVYYDLGAMLDGMLRGSKPREAMETLVLEEHNFRKAVKWAMDDGKFHVAAPMGNTFKEYLERSNRLRERDSWVHWIAETGRESEFSASVVESQRGVALSHFAKGRAGEALKMLQDLKKRLHTTTDFDPTFQLALTNMDIGRIYYQSGHAVQAIPILEENCGEWKALVMERKKKEEEPKDALGNLSTALGDLANALMSTGKLEEARTKAGEGIEIDRKLKSYRNVAAGLARMAQILMTQGKYEEADGIYEEALNHARLCGDNEIEAITLQHQGDLARSQEQYNRASKLLKEALKLFQEAYDEANIMRTCSLIGNVELSEKRYSEARAWYERTREMAGKRGDKISLAVAYQNLGIVCQEEGLEAQKGSDPQQKAQRSFEQAEVFMKEGLEVRERMGSEPDKAGSLTQLAKLHLLTNDMDQAESCAHQARKIDEKFGLKEVFMDYDILAQVAKARGNDKEAAEWETKRNAEMEAQKERAGAKGTMPQEALIMLAQLGQACLRSAAEKKPLSPEVEKAIQQQESAPPPFTYIASFLRSLASAPPVPSVPPGLPPELTELFTQLRNAAEKK